MQLQLKTSDTVRKEEIRRAEASVSQAKANLDLASRQNVLLVPNEAVLAFGNRKMVRVIGEDGLPGPPQPVVTGVSSFDQTEILSGVEEGQQVALGGFERSNRGIPAEFRHMMQNPASTMRRMQGGFGGRGRR